MKSPTRLAQADLSELAKISGVCLDIDETLSTQGKLTAEAYQALWALKSAGFAVVPITGRPAGWCDHIARFWPVDAVVGENGAFTFYMEAGVRKRLDTLPASENIELRKKLEELGKKVRARFPHAKWASDQSYREYDLAIDVCEDVPAWPAADVEELLALCKSMGAHAKLSSIHVNVWFGEYDKKRGFKEWIARGAPGGSPIKSEGPQWLYIGDSPNDEPMFEAFANSVGVANLTQYLPRIAHKPRWLTDASSGAGFAEMARLLISARAARG